MHPPETSAKADEPHPRGRRKYRRWLVLAALAGCLLWLNGPGLRWLAPKVAAHYVGQAGARIRFTLEGSFTGGLTVRDLHLEGYKSLGRLTVARVTPLYQIKELLRGQFQGLEIDGLHAELQLGNTSENPEESSSPPLDLEKLTHTLRDVREQLVPLAIDLKNITLHATRDGNAVITLAASHLHHTAGEPSFKLNLGTLTDSGGHPWPAQETILVWNPGELSIDRLDPLPGVSVRKLVVELPASGGPSAEAEIHADEAVLVVTATPGFRYVKVDLREGRLLSELVAGRFALKLPAKAALTSLSVNIEGLLPDPRAATGAARLLLENIEAGDWRVPELNLDVELTADRAIVATSGLALDTRFTLNAEAPVSRAGGHFQPGDVNGHCHIDDVAMMVAALAPHTPVIDPSAVVPPSLLDSDFTLSWQGLRPAAATVGLSIQPADPQSASTIRVTSRWHANQPLTATLELDGLKAHAEYQPTSFIYQAGMEFKHFNSSRIQRWLAVVKVSGSGTADLTGSLAGGGNLKTGEHRGDLALVRADWSREDGAPPVTASGEIHYQWPGGFHTKDLRVQTRDQIVAADASLANNLLEITNLRWQASGTDVAGGSVSLPVPEDFTHWRDTLAHDTRAVAVTLESKVLPLVLLKDWLPAAARIDPRSTGRVRVNVTGTYAEPVVAVALEAKDLRSLDQPQLPPADLIVSLTGRDGRLVAEGKATTRDYPAAVMTASMGFRPAAWAGEPGLIAKEKFNARVDLPRLDLAKFTALVPAARKVSGGLSGHLEGAGELGKPVFKGKLDLTSGGIELKDERYPAVTGASAAVDLAIDRITMKTLTATVAGGSLQGGGSLAMTAGQPGALDFKVTGRHLPVVRNDSLIIRANADLRLTGTWQHAVLAGTVGMIDSLFYRDIELIPIGTPFTTPSAAELPRIDAPQNREASMPEPYRNWRLNVLARTENPFLIRGNFATGKVVGNVRIGGTLGKPAPDGELKISGFRAALPFSTLTVRSGTARFSPATGFDPVLEIRGNAEPRPYQVSAYVYGQASNPQLMLTSNPPLPDNEIMTLLATGTTSSGLENPQAASSRALQLLAEELRRGRFAVGKQLRPLLGLLDRVDFSLAETDPYSSGSFSTATLSITDRWLISAGMGADGDSRVMGIWRLTFY